MPYANLWMNRECVKQYHTKHAAAIKKYKAAWHQKWVSGRKGTPEYKVLCKERSLKWRKAHPDFYRLKNRKIREQVIALYGGKCACCSEPEIEFLTLDHINGNGRVDRKKHGDCLYAHLLKRKTNRTDLRVLCMNCNWAIRFGKECPHAA